MEIQGYENYLIYEDGRVFSKKRNRFLKPQNHNSGYKIIGLCKNNKVKSFLIHRLMAIHYIPNPENKREVDHINRNRSDNRIENLRWATKSENGQNKGMESRNTSGHKYISYHKIGDGWAFEKTINGKRTRKYFKSLEEAIEFKRSFESDLKNINS